MGLGLGADIRLVDPHSERIGRRDHPQVSDAEPFLNGLLLVRRQPGMVAFGGKPLPLQELRHIFGRLACRAIDHSTGHTFGRQALFDDLKDIGQLGAFPRCTHLETQICARCCQNAGRDLGLWFAPPDGHQ
jgi:hypothetical protein